MRDDMKCLEHNSVICSFKDVVSLLKKYDMTTITEGCINEITSKFSLDNKVAREKLSHVGIQRLKAGIVRYPLPERFVLNVIEEALEGIRKWAQTLADGCSSISILIATGGSI